MPTLTKNIPKSIEKLTFLHKKYELTVPLFIDFDDTKLNKDFIGEITIRTNKNGNFPTEQVQKLRAGFSTKKYCAVYCVYYIHSTEYNILGEFCTTLDLAIKSFEKEINHILSVKVLDEL